MVTVNNDFDLTYFKEINFTIGKRPKNLSPENKWCKVRNLEVDQGDRRTVC
jgi:hypothetical protein